MMAKAPVNRKGGGVKPKSGTGAAETKAPFSTFDAPRSFIQQIGGTGKSGGTGKAKPGPKTPKK
jgi:hypothetical protein